MPLSVDDYRKINEHVNFHRGRLEGMQLSVSASDDMAEFVRERSQFPGYIHPAYDPDRSSFPTSGAFWVAVRDGAKMVACAATRRFDQTRLLDLFMSRQVWFSKCSVIDDMEPMAIGWPSDVFNVEGTLAVHGSLIVCQEYGKRGIGTHLIRLVRAASLRSWRQDWNFGLVKAEMKETGFQHRRYGYPLTCAAYDEKPSWGPRHDIEYLNLISQSEMLAEYSTEPGALGL